MMSSALHSKVVAGHQSFTPTRAVPYTIECNYSLPVTHKRGPLRNLAVFKSRSVTYSVRQQRRGEQHLRAKSFFNWEEEPLVKEAVKEPIAFFGGFFAGLLRLNLDEEPLKEWLTRTADAAGVVEDDDASPAEEDGPVEISIE
eukprot:TRINITY_DN7676_c0_g1_i1.p1 TRINITY_DN7676_c0_g1~~TRINITY_DN7676_c0_g1_i1.p1  ORF type:complete len:143 (-),score=28.62 TRINITY_DN7676_c0_g1_i1:407-835(-)